MLLPVAGRNTEYTAFVNKGTPEHSKPVFQCSKENNLLLNEAIYLISQSKPYINQTHLAGIRQSRKATTTQPVEHVPNNLQPRLAGVEFPPLSAQQQGVVDVVVHLEQQSLRIPIMYHDDVSTNKWTLQTQVTDAHQTDGKLKTHTKMNRNNCWPCRNFHLSCDVVV